MKLAVLLGSRPIAGSEILVRDCSLDDNPPRLLPDLYLVAATDVKLLTQLFRERDLTTVADVLSL